MNKKTSDKGWRIGVMALLWCVVLTFLGASMQRSWSEPTFLLMNYVPVFAVPILSVWILGGVRLLKQDVGSSKRVNKLLVGNALLCAGGIWFIYCTIQMPLIRLGQSGGMRWDPPFFVRNVPVESIGPIFTVVLWVLTLGFVLLGVLAGFFLLKSRMSFPLLFLDYSAGTYCVFIIRIIGEMSSPKQLESTIRMGERRLFLGAGAAVLCLAVLFWLKRKRVG